MLIPLMCKLTDTIHTSYFSRTYTSLAKGLTGLTGLTFSSALAVTGLPIITALKPHFYPGHTLSGSPR